MNKPKPIKLSIPHPCTQNWDEMIPDGQGRHCAHCQKTVIDFTTWSDAALYKYFSNYDGKACGRLLSTQLNRPIHIPHQPHSKLYRMTVALGFTLLFAQTPRLLAQTSSPIVNQASDTAKTKGQLPSMTNRGSIAGRVSDDKKELLINATVQFFQDSILKGGTITDFDGNYIIDSLKPGKYKVVINYYGYDSAVIQRLPVYADTVVTLNMALKRNSEYPEPHNVISGYISSMINRDEPTKRTITSNQLNHMPH